MFYPHYRKNKRNIPILSKNYLHASTSYWDEARWMEWHADKFSAGILMPESAVRTLISNPDCMSENRNISLVSETFNVSEQAAYLRLCDLGYIRQPQDESTYKQLSFL